MGHQIIKEPDGKYCIWSTVVDDFIATGGTKEDIIEYYSKKYAEEAERKIDDLKKDISLIDAGETSRVYYQFAMTYEEAAKRRKGKAK